MIKLRNWNVYLLLVILVVATSCNDRSETLKETTSNKNFKIFQKVIDTIYASNPESVGLMVHIESPKNGISWSGSAGYSGYNKTKLDAEQPMLIASSIKTYIAATILRLQEDEKLSIEDNISQHLSSKTIDLFQTGGYDFNSVKIMHLLSHTSGIADYVNDDYIDFIDKNQKYRWTRDEQLQLATKVGSPLGKVQDVFSYSDVNYLLCTEIIEQITKKPFYTAIRELLKYETLNLVNTWFPTLEEKPKNTKALVHQYWNVKEWGSKKIDINWDSYNHDISWDLYGGGGIASTTKEMAQFSYNLFNGNIIEDQEVLNLIFKDVETTDGKSKSYRLGLAETTIKGLKSYGHGGFWGTMVFYIPQLDASISVSVLERKGKMKVIRSTLNAIVTQLANLLQPTEHIISDNYELYKATNSKATLVLFPGGGATAADTKKEFDIITAATAKNISVVFMNFNYGLWLDEIVTKELAEVVEDIFIDNELNSKNTFIGGMSIGGNVSLIVSNYLNQQKSNISLKGIFIVDSPIDLYALYESSIKDISNPDLNESRLAEPKWIIRTFEEQFGGKDSLLLNIQKFSPFTLKTKNELNIQSLKKEKIRFYTEPDTLWIKQNRLTDFENTNAFILQKTVKVLKKKNWKKVELIQTKNKGYRVNGERNPHSWSIVDKDNLILWILE